MPRKPKKPNMPEKALHEQIAQLFVRVLPKSIMWWHTPNGEKRDAVTAAILKRMGVVAGVPDFLLYDLHTGYLHCMEVKRADGYLNDEQRGWKARFDQSPTGRYAVVRSFDEAMQVVLEWWPGQTRINPLTVPPMGIPPEGVKSGRGGAAIGKV